MNPHRAHPGPVRSGGAAVAGTKDRETGHVVAKVVENTDTKTLQCFVIDHTEPRSIPMT